MHTVEDDSSFGERSGLVEAKDVDAGQALDRCQLLDENLVPGRPDRAAAKATLESKTRPSGIRAMTLAITPTSAAGQAPLAMACSQPPLDCISPLATMRATGIAPR